MSKVTDVSVLRGMMEGEAVTLENVTLWETYTDIVTKEKKREFAGYEYRYVQNGAPLPHSLFPSLLRRHLVTPVTDEETQTFVVTKAGELVATYEQAGFELELPQIVEYA